MKKSSRKTILAVDDKPENLKVLIQYLENSGFELMVAQSGEETLQHVRRITPDIILLDVLMPGMDGFETCRRLKEERRTHDVPVIFMTALTETVDKVRGFQAGAVDYLTKPLQQAEVLARVKSHITMKDFQERLQKQNLLLKKKNTQLRKYTDKINADIDRARKVQQRFLPSHANMPCPDNIDWASCFEPADEVGGDYFDVGLIGDDRIAIIFSDVCGHGMPAAFITAVLKTTFQGWLDSANSLTELGAALNLNLFRLTPIDSFAAVFIAIYDCKTGRFQYTNFGHYPQPLLIPKVKSKPVQPLLDADSLVMGAVERVDLPLSEVILTPGDRMLFVSDGIIDNRNPLGQMYGMERFEVMLEENRSLSVRQLVEEIRKNRECFTGKGEQFDDCTVLAFQIHEERRKSA